MSVASSVRRDAVEPAPAVAASRLNAASTSATVRPGSCGRVGQRPERAEADPQPPLRQHPGQVRHDDADLGRVTAREEIGQGLGLGGA